MAIEDFKHLIEAQSLEKKIKEHLDLVEAQQNRVVHIEKQRKQAKNLKSELEEELTKKTNLVNKTEKDLFEAEAKVEKTNEHIPLARNEQEATALQKELDSLNPLVEKLQEDALQLMEETEILAEQIKEKDEFLEGSKSSLNEIKKEADEEIKKEEVQIKGLQERVDSLLSQVSSTHKNSYFLSNERHKFNNPLCFVDNSACNICRFTLNQIQANEIEKGEVTESCPGCGRLLTPLSAKNI